MPGHLPLQKGSPICVTYPKILAKGREYPAKNINTVLVDGSLIYWDLDYCNFTILGSIEYSIYSSNSSIIGISNLEIVVPKLPGF